MGADQGEVQEAVYELHQYLSDQKAPLMVADSVTFLLQYPAKFLADQVVAWVAAQSSAAPVSDYLYHGAKKIFLLGEFELLPKEGLSAYLGNLCDELVQHCPAADQALLSQNLQRLGQAAAAVTIASPTVLHRQKPESNTAAEPVLTREVRRLSLLLEHLRPLASAPPEQRQELASQFMTSAAVQAASGRELDDRLAPLRQLGISTATDQIFRTIARSLAGWALPLQEGQQAPRVSREQLDAMRQLVSLAEDPAEAARRFREMVHAAIEQFNEGQLGRAANMFELAERLAVEKKVQAQFVDALRTQGHQYLDPEKLRQFAERTDSRPQLRGILNFFTALQPLGLLRSLNGEPKRDRRRQLLALLEVHEQAARSAAWDLLQASLQQPGADPFFQMNLAYLLRIIPRPDDALVEAEVNALMQTSGRTSPPPLVKQVIAYLANSHHDKAERALITYLRVFESMLVQPETAVYPATELEVLLDRTCAALARYGTPRAWRAMIDHGLKSDARLGSPFTRLAEAGNCDLSSSRDLVERLLTAIPADLPRTGVLGMVVKGNEDRAVALVQALSGTPRREVRELLRDIAGKYATRKVGEAAVKALASLDSIGKPPPPPPGISGDLELFGLPNLLQALGQSKFSGVLTLMDSRGRPAATLLVEKGLFRGGQYGDVKGTDAIYQLLERPFPGTFAFVSRADVGKQWHLGPEHDMTSLILEGVRRYDEFNRAAAVAPDHVHVKPTGKPRTPLADEASAFVAALWGQISPQKSVLECETAMCVDSYRVRRVVAHWIEEGALQPV